MAYELCETGRCTGPSSGLGGAGSLYDIWSPVNIANAGTPSRAHGLGFSLKRVLKLGKAAVGTVSKVAPLVPGVGPVAGALIAAGGSIISGSNSPTQPTTAGFITGRFGLSPTAASAAGAAAKAGGGVSVATPTFVPTSTPAAAATVTPLAAGVGPIQSGIDTRTLLILGGAGLALLLLSRRQ